MSPKLLISLVDLTNLNQDCQAEAIDQLCQKTLTPHGPVAAVCVYPRFVAQAKQALKGSSVKVATVCNFPSGDEKLAETIASIEQAVQDGADEIDLVLPYKKWLSGQKKAAICYVEQCQTACQTRRLKVIVESGAFDDVIQLRQACMQLLALEVDFLKTSTGKIAQGASLEAAQLMLTCIKDSAKTTGFKVSGGVRSVAQAEQYLTLAETILGKNWISPARFRIGASRLLEEILEQSS